MRVARAALGGMVLIVASCATGPEVFQPGDIVGGTARIVKVEAWTPDRTAFIADLTPRFSGSVTIVGEQVSGTVTVDGAESAVVGAVQQEGASLAFEVTGIPPERLIVLYHNEDRDHYTLVGGFLQKADLVGDSLPETYRTYYYMAK